MGNAQHLFRRFSAFARLIARGPQLTFKLYFSAPKAAKKQPGPEGLSQTHEKSCVRKPDRRVVLFRRDSDSMTARVCHHNIRHPYGHRAMPTCQSRLGKTLPHAFGRAAPDTTLWGIAALFGPSLAGSALEDVAEPDQLRRRFTRPQPAETRLVGDPNPNPASGQTRVNNFYEKSHL